VAVELLAMAMGEGAQSVAEFSRYAEVARLGGPELGLVVLTVAVLALPVADQLRDAAAMRVPASGLADQPVAASAPTGFSFDGIAIDKVHPYDRNGRLLHDVRLYDGFGRPLDFGRNFANPDRRAVRDAKGATVFNAYPVRYFEPGTKRVAHPQAGSPVTPPRLTTPPAGARRR
jgi:hypothetical protein